MSASAPNAAPAAAEPIDHSAAVQGVPPAGSIAFLYGFEPVIIFGEEADGSIEVARFASFEYHPAGDLNVGPRGDKPIALLPVAPSPEDRVAALEDQVRVLTELLTQLAHSGGSLTPAVAAPLAAAQVAAAAPEPPAQPFIAPAAPTSPAPASPAAYAGPERRTATSPRRVEAERRVTAGASPTGEERRSTTRRDGVPDRRAAHEGAV